MKDKIKQFDGYIWVITKDHIAEPGAEPRTNSNAVGMYNADFTPTNVESVKQIVGLLRFLQQNEDNIINLERFDGI
jgi:hypothetical protein